MKSSDGFMACSGVINESFSRKIMVRENFCSYNFNSVEQKEYCPQQ